MAEFVVYMVGIFRSSVFGLYCSMDKLQHKNNQISCHGQHADDFGIFIIVHSFGIVLWFQLLKQDQLSGSIHGELSSNERFRTNRVHSYLFPYV